MSEQPPDSDSTIIVLERARQGDHSAARMLLQRALPLVRRWAHGRVPHEVRRDANTEDVLQDAVIRTLGNLKRFEHRTVSGLQYYLRRSVVNRIRDLVRGSRRRPTATALPEDLPGHEPTPIERAIRKERLDRFLAALAQLTPAERQLLIFRFELGYTTPEIAKAVGISAGAASMRLARATEKVQKLLGIDLEER